MQLVKLLLSISRAPVAAVVAAGLVSGVANTYLLFLISHVLAPGSHTGATGFAITGAVALVAAVVSQLLMVRLTQDAIYRLRAQLSAGVVSAPLERLERLGAHRLLATLTEDVQSLSQAVSALPSFCVDVVTIIGALVFLSVVSGPIFAVTVAGTAASILGVEALLRRVRRQYREARECEDALLRSFQSVTVGIKELKLHRGRRQDFMDRHLLGSAAELRSRNVAAATRSSFAQGYGRLTQLATMAVVLFLLAPLLRLGHDVMFRYVLVTIFLSMPMQSFMSRIPNLLRGNVALAKIRGMNLSMRSATDEQNLPYTDGPAAPTARLELVDATYSYRGAGFHLGPLNLMFVPGQITFVVGGNGSGKSTLAKLLAGLYVPETGFVTLNGEPVGHHNIEWFRQNCSAIFTDFHLFEDYLGFHRPGVDDEVRHYLNKLELAHKVSVHDGRLSTLALSQGQRKRLALLTALLEDRPIYLFDEWAADQEPRFRDVFYTEILPGLARRGKTVVVVTHDDRYFACADKIVKLDFGHVAAEFPAATEFGPQEELFGVCRV